MISIVCKIVRNTTSVIQMIINYWYQYVDISAMQIIDKCVINFGNHHWSVPGKNRTTCHCKKNSLFMNDKTIQYKI